MQKTEEKETEEKKEEIKEKSWAQILEEKIKECKKIEEITRLTETAKEHYNSGNITSDEYKKLLEKAEERTLLLNIPF